MKKYKSETAKALHEGFLADFKAGTISEAELKEFEAEAFIDGGNEVDDANEVAGEFISLSQSINQK